MLLLFRLLALESKTRFEHLEGAQYVIPCLLGLGQQDNRLTRLM